MLQIDTTLCTQCGLCEKVCPSSAIDFHTGEIADSCISCYHCVSVCPSRAVSHDDEPVLPLQGENPTSDSLALLIKKRRSVRHFKQEPIPREELEKWLQELRFSPTASNSRKVNITMITDPLKIKDINDQTRDGLMNAFKKITNPFLKPILRPLLGHAYSKAKKYKTHFSQKSEQNPNLITYKAPVVVIAHMPTSMMGLPEMDCNIWGSYGTLLAEARGWGTCFNGYIVKALNKNKKLKETFGIPKNHKVFSCFLMGYPTIKYSNEIIRDSFSVNWQ